MRITSETVRLLISERLSTACGMTPILYLRRLLRPFRTKLRALVPVTRKHGHHCLRDLVSTRTLAANRKRAKLHELGMVALALQLVAMEVEVHLVLLELDLAPGPRFVTQQAP